MLNKFGPFEPLLEIIKDRSQSLMKVTLSKDEIKSFEYFLTRNSFYAVIVDDFTTKISDRNTLLEALYYQVRLITVHNLNWDAVQEGFIDAAENFGPFDGICLLFRDGGSVLNAVSQELETLEDVITEVNSKVSCKKTTIVLNH